MNYIFIIANKQRCDIIYIWSYPYCSRNDSWKKSLHRPV